MKAGKRILKNKDQLITSVQIKREENLGENPD